MKESLKIYTLHPSEEDLSIYGCGVVARNPQEAAAMLGGVYEEPEGGIKQAAYDPEELHFVGFVIFHPALFREMTSNEREIAGIFAGRKCYVKGQFRLLMPHSGKQAVLAMREHLVMLPEYVTIGY